MAKVNPPAKNLERRTREALQADKQERSAAFNRARKLLNPKLRIAETIEFKCATTPDGAPDRPAAAPPV